MERLTEIIASGVLAGVLAGALGLAVALQDNAGGGSVEVGDLAAGPAGNSSAASPSPPAIRTGPSSSSLTMSNCADAVARLATQGDR